MKKITYFVAGLLLISGFAAIGIGEEAVEQQETITLTFSDLKVIDSITEPYLELNYEGTGGRLYHANEPILPIYQTKMTLPFGTLISGIECEIGEVQTMTLSNKIVPAPTPQLSGYEQTSEPEYIMDETIYNSNELFPNNWFDYHIGVGLDENNDHKTFLVIRAFPVRYSPGTDTVEYVENLDLTVSYILPETDPFPTTADYDLIIIAPKKFENELQKLINHKNDMGMATLFKSTQDIYDEYTGVDKPEQIKYFIKDALETYNNKYVLIVGGLKSLIFGEPRDDRNQGTKDWHVPVRYTNLRDSGGTYDPGTISDLYYADIYKAGAVFDDWDSNNDGIFASWYGIKKDVLDFYPDVYVGRLPCRNSFEVKIMVNKIVNYEKQPAPDSWYKKIILIGGDSFDDPGTNYLEGEVVCERVADDYMSEYTQIKLYASNKNSDPDMTPTGTNIIRELTKGAGHIFFDGHASPMSWSTHWPYPEGGWTERFWVFDFPYILNGKKLPILAVEGCHNNQFNLTLLSSMRDKDNSGHQWVYGMPVPECWGWWLTRKIGGGSLSSAGNTGLGYGATGEHGDLDGDGIVEPDILEALGGYFFDQFYLIFDGGADILGDVHSGTLTNYCDTFPGMSYQLDAKTLEQQILIGDPSLKIGGYPASQGLRAEIVDAAAGVVGAPSEDVMFEATAFNAVGEITYSWDFDNDGEYDDAEGDVVSWSWDIPGGYWVSVKVTDEEDVDIYDTLAGIQFGASKTVVKGETNIKVGREYEYTGMINTQTGYWNHIVYMFSWGDEEVSDWLETSSASHKWLESGIYVVKTKAMLTHETEDGETADFKETEWSDPLLITVERSRTRQLTIFDLLQYFFEKHQNAFPLLQQLLGL